jgi:cytochrome o ubiquinol oxidase operon protein cyoD
MTSHAPVSSSNANLTPGTYDGRGHGGVRGYLVGYAASWLLTIGSFAAARSPVLTPYSATAAVTVLAIAQMLVHLIFFLHISTSPNQRTNILALGTTMFVVLLVVAGSLWIMSHLQSNMMPVDQVMRMQR